MDVMISVINLRTKIILLGINQQAKINYMIL